MGLVEEGQEVMEKGPTRRRTPRQTLLLLVRHQRVEHYEISGYTTAETTWPSKFATAQSWSCCPSHWLKKKIPISALIPRASRIDFSFIAGPGGIVEELVHLNLPMLKGGFFILSSAAAKAFIWVISPHQSGTEAHPSCRSRSQKLMSLSSGVIFEPRRDVKLTGNLRDNQPSMGFPCELNRLTPPPPAMAMSGSASAACREILRGLRCIRTNDKDPRATISRWLSSSSVATTMPPRDQRDPFNPDLRSSTREYSIAAANSPFAPPNCSRSMFPNRTSGSSTRTVNISFFTW